MKLPYLLAAPLFVALCAMPASARDYQGEHNSGQHVRDADRDHDGARQHSREEREQHLRREREERAQRLRHEREARWRREHHADHHDPFRNHERDRHSGWEQGKKNGWHNDHVPPGQAKKTAYEKHRDR